MAIEGTALKRFSPTVSRPSLSRGVFYLFSHTQKEEEEDDGSLAFTSLECVQSRLCIQERRPFFVGIYFYIPSSGVLARSGGAQHTYRTQYFLPPLSSRVLRPIRGHPGGDSLYEQHP